MEKYLPWLKSLAVFVGTEIILSLVDYVQHGGVLNSHAQPIIVSAAIIAAKTFVVKSPFPGKS